MRSKNLTEITDEVVLWANEVLPDRTVQEMLLKMVEELGEVAKNPSDPSQLADILIILVDIADKFSVDLSSAFDYRMSVNRTKDWKINKFTGVHDRVDE